MRYLLTLITVVFFSSCMYNDVYRYNEYDFSNLPAYNIDVGRIKFEHISKTPRAFPHVAHLAPISLENAFKKWATEKMRPAGNSQRYLKMFIIESSIIEKKLPNNSRFSGLFREADVEYVANLEVRFEIYDHINIVPINTMELKVDRTIAANSSDSPAERERTLYNLTKTTIFDFAKHVDTNIGQYLNAYLR